MRILKRLATAGLGMLSFVALNSHAELPDGFFVDHGYTYFTLESTSTVSDRKRIDTGWKLNGAIRIYGNAPERSSIKLVVKQDGDVLAERRTQTTVYKKGNPNLGMVISSTAAGTARPHLLSGVGYQGALDAVQTGTGEYEVDVIYIDGDSDREYAAHTYIINVGKIESLDAVANKLVVRPPKYFVSRHQELLSSILTPWFAYPSDAAGRYQLLWNASPQSTDKSPVANGAYLRCSVNGNPQKLGNPKYVQYDSGKKYDAATTATAQNRSIRELHSDRNALDYRGGTAYRENFIFNTYLTAMPFEDDTDDYPPAGWDQESSLVTMARHPGRWECQLIDNGTVVRTFMWDVDDNGQLVPHEEQEEGLTLSPGAILVETIIPDGGASFDSRIVADAVKKGGFYGWKWDSRAMKNLARKLPDVGTPYPVASAPEFIPVPDKGPSPQEIAKAKRQADAAAAREQRAAQQDARDKKLSAEREQFSKDDAARVAENERIRSEAMREEMDRTQAMVAEQLARANASSADAMRDATGQRSDSAMYTLFRILLSIVLVLSGLLLAGGKIPGLSVVVERLVPLAGTVGLATIGVALFDLVLDVIAFRPVIGDGLAQLVALLSGSLLARATLQNVIKNEKVSALMDVLKANQAGLGFSAMAFGIIHLLMGGAALI